MSKNITIKEGKTGHSFGNVKEIKIKNTDNSWGIWVPKDETVLGTKHITENGTYKASEEVDEHQQNRGWYGYSEVTVSGIGTASGIDPATGEESTTKKNPDTNELETKKDVTGIAFITYPNKLIYYDGEHIDLSGALICGKTSKGNRWEGNETHPNGIIPLEEVTVNPEVAVYDPDAHGEYTSDLQITGFNQPISASQTGVVKADVVKNNKVIAFDTEEIICGNKGRCLIYGRENGSTYDYMVASQVQDDSYQIHKRRVDAETGAEISNLSIEGHVQYSYTHDNKTVYYMVGITYMSNSSKITDIEQLADASISQLSNDDKGKLAWTIVYGHEEHIDTGENVTVTWKRTQPDDKKELSTTFEIRVLSI